MDSICVQFKTSNNFLGTIDELDWRHDRQDELDALLMEIGLGMCDGGQSGGGSMEIFCFVNDIPKAVKLIENHLTNNEWLQFSKIASFTEGDGKWKVHYPKDVAFSPMEWL